MSSSGSKSLENLREYSDYYRRMSEKLVKAGADPEQAYVTYPEMYQILSDVNTIFKSVFGVGMKVNAVGQKLPEKRVWEVRG